MPKHQGDHGAVRTRVEHAHRAPTPEAVGAHPAGHYPLPRESGSSQAGELGGVDRRRQAGRGRELVKEPPPEDGEDVHWDARRVEARCEGRDGGRPPGHGLRAGMGLGPEELVEPCARRSEEVRVCAEEALEPMTGVADQRGRAGAVTWERRRLAREVPVRLRSEDRDVDHLGEEQHVAQLPFEGVIVAEGPVVQHGHVAGRRTPGPLRAGRKAAAPPPAESAPGRAGAAGGRGGEEGDLLGEDRAGGPPPKALRAAGPRPNRGHQRVARGGCDPRQGAQSVDGAAPRLRLRVARIAGTLRNEEIGEDPRVRRQPRGAVGRRKAGPGPERGEVSVPRGRGAAIRDCREEGGGNRVPAAREELGRRLQQAGGPFADHLEAPGLTSPAPADGAPKLLTGAELEQGGSSSCRRSEWRVTGSSPGARGRTAKSA